MNKDEILKKLSQEKEYIQSKYEVEKIGLFHKYKNNNKVILENIQKDVIYDL